MPAANLSKNHRLVLDLIERNGVGTHVTAFNLLTQAKRRQPKIGLATVHRALAQLHDQGLIAKVWVPGSEAATYEPLASPHAHFSCRTCGAVEDVPYALPARTRSDLAARARFRIDEEHVTLVGLCQKCLRPPKKAR